MRNDLERSRVKNWRRQLARRCLLLAWIVNAGLLVTVFIWTYCDGRSRHAIDWSRRFAGVSSVEWIETDSAARTSSIQVAVGTIAAFAISSFVIAGGLVFGSRKFRSMRAWMLFLSLACGWLGFAVSWPEVYWYGQQQRLRPILAQAESLARHLESNWPEEDGDLPQVGPYLAYPKGNPTAILPLQWITFPNTSLRFSAIERAADGAIRFELAGREAGAWLEWRADDRAPMPFKSGLEMHYNVGRQQRLAPRWFLVRYRPSAVDLS